MTPERIGILGGTFNPVHTGHLIIAQDALEQFELDRVIWMPASVPPHKQDQGILSNELRFRMLEEALLCDPRFEISSYEMEKGGVSYSVETMRTMRDLYPGAELYFIIGSDSLVELHTWKSINELLELCRFVTFVRPGFTDDVSLLREKILLDDANREKLLQGVFRCHAVEISSTDIRARVAEGLSIRYLVPPEVECFIAEHHLYL